jgi:HAMP domain-containing protein
VSLVSKIVSSAAIPVALVLGAAGASMVALDRAGEASRHTLARLAPIVDEVANAEETLAALGRLHARWVTIRDPAYEEAWTARMGSLEQSLHGLGGMLDPGPERRRWAKARLAVTRYRDLVATDEALRPLDVPALREATTARARARRALGAIPAEVQATAQQAERHAGSIAVQARNALVAGGLLAGAFALLLSGWIGRRVARGLDSLADASAALERGRLDQPVAIDGRDELARLAVAFEALAAGLGERDRVCEDTIRRLGQELVEPLRTICDATGALARDLRALPMHDQTLVLLIAEAAEDLRRHADRIAVDPSRPDARPALPAPPVGTLPARPALPALITFAGKDP